MNKNKVIKPSNPLRNVDENDIVFSRMRLVPGTKDWGSYYSAHPDQAVNDEIFRKLPGLLSENGTNYHPFNFTAADTNFELIEYLQKAINHSQSVEKEYFSSEDLTKYIMGWVKYLGAHSAGIAELKDYHLYTVRGRGVDKGKPVIRRHEYAIAFTVEMDLDNVCSAPGSPSIFESSQQYLRGATIALQLATFLKRLGYESRAHIDGDYEVICPLVARDAGLGEIGRMGLLMTPGLGPRVRIAVVTTNAPLVSGKYQPYPSIVEFCRICKKCAECCPGDSIPKGVMQDIDGIKRWKIDSDACYKVWCTTGTDCGRCLAVCPFSHRNNIIHNIIRFIISRSRLFVHFAYYADNLVYGRKPKSKKGSKWMNKAIKGA